MKNFDGIDVINIAGFLDRLASRQKPIVFILGAGASISSGIHGADFFVKEWLQTRFLMRQRSADWILIPVG